MSDLFLLSIVFSILAAVSWGINSHIIKAGIRDENPFLAMVFRSIAAFILLTVGSIVIFGIDSVTMYFKPEILPLVLLTSLLVICGDGIFLYSLKLYPVNVMQPISSVYPLVTSFILLSTGIETVNIYIILGTILVILGVIYVTSNIDGPMKTKIETKALIYGVITAIFWGTSIYFVRFILEFDGSNAIGLTGVRTMFMGLGSLLVFLLSPGEWQKYNNRERSSKLASIKYMFLSGIIGWVIGATLFFAAVQYIGAAIPTPITSTNPIIAVVIGKYLGIEKINGKQMIGILSSVLGTIIIVMF
ncbi:MAG: DMT family transporter [Candidatus Heimdallarchaeota archaeon]|nr:DMT family transporter [Candidatus Heimdallarchaeota archaeon]